MGPLARLARRVPLVLALLLAACMDRGPVEPVGTDAFPTPVAGARVDGSTTGSDDLYFLPPLVEQADPQGIFNPGLLPAVRVCEVVAGSCGPDAAYFGAGTVSVGNERYELDWDTEGPETAALDPERPYRLQVEVAGTVLGFVDLDPVGPNSIPQPVPGAYAFRIGETVPVRFWLSTETLCQGAGYVVECISGAVLDERGGTLALDQGGERLAIFLPAGGLPGPAHPPVTFVLERLDPDLFLGAEGVECIPLFDAPQFGPCFRVTTIPRLEDELDQAALVSICIDPATLPGIRALQGQEDQLQIVRVATDGSGVIEGLANVPGDCPTEVGARFPVPERGPMRWAALGANALAELVGPTPLWAHGNISLGGLTSSFSRFRFALPGQMLAVQGDGAVIQAGDPPAVEVGIRVVDHEGIPVAHARLHFATGDGTLGAPQAVTDADGDATVTWTVDDATTGAKTLTVSALGLLDGPVPDHSAALPFTAASIQVTATVVGPPSSIDRSPSSPVTGTAGQEVPTPLVITVADADGNPVAGAPVGWDASGDGAVSGDPATASDGTASGTWTLPTAAGPATATATVGGVTATFTADVEADAPAVLAVEGDGQTGPAGRPLPQPLTILLTDTYGNPVGDEPVIWTAADGTVSGDPLTGSDGTASATWVLGATPGSNTASVSVAGLGHTFTATGGCLEGFGTATVDGSFGGAEWACARSVAFTANLSGSGTPASVHWMNDGTTLYLAVRLRQADLEPKNGLRVDFDNDGDGIHEVGDDAVGFDADAGVFLDEHLTLRCANNGQSGCGEPDARVDGSGAAANDGTWTTYELSHPLADGDPQDFSRSAGDPLGFFLTIRVGNGAKGNTQFPGFRIFQQLTVAGR